MTGRIDPTLFSINGQSAAPLYHRIKQNLHDLLEAQALKDGQMLPSESELGKYYGVSRLTVRQAIGALVQEGLLRRQHGVGTFVAGPKLTQLLANVGSFSERMREAGHAPSSRVLSQQVIPAPVNVARRLKIDPGAPVHKLARLHCSDGTPVMIETAYLPQSLFPGLEKIDFSCASLYRTLHEKFNCRIVEADETLEPIIPNKHEAELLQAGPNTPAIIVEVDAFNQSAQVVEYSKSIVRGDRSRYVFHIKRHICARS